MLFVPHPPQPPPYLYPAAVEWYWMMLHNSPEILSRKTLLEERWVFKTCSLFVCLVEVTLRTVALTKKRRQWMRVHRSCSCVWQRPLMWEWFVNEELWISHFTRSCAAFHVCADQCSHLRFFFWFLDVFKQSIEAWAAESWIDLHLWDCTATCSFTLCQTNLTPVPHTTYIPVCETWVLTRLICFISAKIPLIQPFAT